MARRRPNTSTLSPVRRAATVETRDANTGYTTPSRPTDASGNFQRSEGIIDAIVGGAVGFVTGGPAGAVAGAAGGLLGGGGGGGGGGAGGMLGGGFTGFGAGGSYVPRGLSAPQGCPPNLVLNPKNGVCEFPGSPGDVSTAGGGPVYAGDLPPGAAPATVVGNIEGNPIFRCPSRFVLADPAMFGEGVCFHRSVLPNRLRKWPKSAKAKISAHDWKMMRRYGPGGSKQKRVKEIAQAAGFSCKKR